MARPIGSFCSLLLAWFCVLGAAPARHSAAQPFAIRSAAELALRGVAEVPLLAARPLIERAAGPRSLERDSVSPLSWIIALHSGPARRSERATRTTLGHQAAAHARRPRWRTYDAAAPPALSRIAR